MSDQKFVLTVGASLGAVIYGARGTLLVLSGIAGSGFLPWWMVLSIWVAFGVVIGLAGGCGVLLLTRDGASLRSVAMRSAVGGFIGASVGVAAVFIPGLVQTPLTLLRDSAPNILIYTGLIACAVTLKGYKEKRRVAQRRNDNTID